MLEKLIEFPKSEIHLHLAGSFDCDSVFEIAKRNSLSPALSYSEYKATQESFSCLNDLLSLIRVNLSVMRFESDIHSLTLGVLARLASQNIVYAEPALNIGFLMNPLISPESILNGIHSASTEAESLYNIKTGWILEFSRSRPIEMQSQTISSIHCFKDRFKGIGVAENEFDNPSKNFEELYRLAKNLGFAGPEGKNATAHTGEETPPSYIEESLKYLQISRIDHGIRAFEDARLMKKLGDEKFSFAMAPISNKKLKILDKFFGGRYIYNDFIESGCTVSINSDDPGAFNENLTKNYLDFYENYNGEHKELALVNVIKNGFFSSFLSQQEKDYWISDINRRYSDILNSDDH